MNDLTNIPISAFIIICIWLLVIVSILVTKYRGRQGDDLSDTERRSRKRRVKDGHEKSGSIDSVDESRSADDRRDGTNWESDYRAIRNQVEDETSREEL